jgi:hypothetical protein
MIIVGAGALKTDTSPSIIIVGSGILGWLLGFTEMPALRFCM